MVTKTFRQARKDKREEREARHPRFKVLGGAVEWVTHIEGDHTINPYYELWVVLQNVKENSAFRVRLDAAVCPNISSAPILSFTREPTDDIDSENSFEAKTKIALPKADSPYYLELTLTYRDRRTHAKYRQTLYRKFYLLDEDITRPLLGVDKSEWRMFYEEKLKEVQAKQLDPEGPGN